MRRIFVLLTVVLAACADITGTPTQPMKGTWTLRRYDRHALPAFEYSVDNDSVFLVADTLQLDGHGSYDSATWVSVRTPSGTSAVRTDDRGTYTTAGDSIMIRPSMTTELAGILMWGRRIGDSLFLPADTTTCCWMHYER